MLSFTSSDYSAGEVPQSLFQWSAWHTVADRAGSKAFVCNNRLGCYSLAQIARRDCSRLLLSRKLSLGRFVLPILSWGAVSPFQGECYGLCSVHGSRSLGSLRTGCLEDWHTCVPRSGLVCIPLCQHSLVKFWYPVLGGGVMWSFYMFIPWNRRPLRYWNRLLN